MGEGVGELEGRFSVSWRRDGAVMIGLGGVMVW
jgi:hypothetical protein